MGIEVEKQANLVLIVLLDTETSEFKYFVFSIRYSRRLILPSSVQSPIVAYYLILMGLDVLNY